MKSTIEDVSASGGAIAEPLAAALIEACPDAVVVTDPAWRPLAWNRRFADLWRLDAAIGVRAIWRRIRRVLIEKRGILAAWRATGGGPFCATVALTDGRWIEIRGAALDPSGSAPARAWFCRDVTERVLQDK